MFKVSTVLCLVIYNLFAQSECFWTGPQILTAELANKVMGPITKLFNPDKNEEHGQLASLGRDVIKETAKTIDEIKTGVHHIIKLTTGLDTDKNLFGGDINAFKSAIKAIHPGTKWCGDGNIASSQNDLGVFASVDACCREHDQCPLSISADEKKFGLSNTGLFTRSECKCDRKFYFCLKNATCLVADAIGHTFFTILGPQCFQEDYPIDTCLTRQLGRCIKYSTLKEKGEKTYQWFDNPFY